MCWREKQIVQSDGKPLNGSVQMKPTTCLRYAIGSILIGAAACSFAAAGDPPATGLDLGALKPKSDAGTTGGTASAPGSLMPFGSPLSKPKPAVDQNVVGAPVKSGVGTAIKSPLGTKGVLGGPASPGAPGLPAADDTSSSDVVVKMPNMKK